jgi:hypothetical protein
VTRLYDCMTEILSGMFSISCGYSCSRRLYCMCLLYVWDMFVSDFILPIGIEFLSHELDLGCLCRYEL